MTQEILKLATSVRRRTRDLEVLDLCDKVLAHIAKSALKKTCPQCQILHGGREELCDHCACQNNMKPFDKTAYMRDYMRKRRAKP